MKYTLGILLSLMVGLFHPALGVPQSTYVEDSSNAIVTVKSAQSGIAYKVLKFTISASTADNFVLKCGSTQKYGKVYLGANSGLTDFVNDGYPYVIQQLFKCSSNEAVTVTKGTAGTPISVTLWYEETNE